MRTRARMLILSFASVWLALACTLSGGIDLPDTPLDDDGMSGDGDLGSSTGGGSATGGGPNAGGSSGSSNTGGFGLGGGAGYGGGGGSDQ